MKQRLNIIGMNRDVSRMKADGTAAFEIRNMRMMPVDTEETMASLTNERGPLLMELDVHGTPIGSFSINEWFGIYSFDETFSYITLYRRVGEGTAEDYVETLRYQDSTGVLDFKSVAITPMNMEAPSWLDGVQSTPSYESATSIRVYWIDSVHELRVMDFLDLWIKCKDGRQDHSVDDGVYVIDDTRLDPSFFSYLPSIKRITDVEVNKNHAGSFHSGTVQFCVTEVVNANESNIVHYSPLYYCSDDVGERGFPDDNEDAGVSFDVSFKLKDVADTSGLTHFIVYCIHRSVRNGTPTVYRREIAKPAVAGVDYVYSTTFVGAEETAASDHLLFKNSLKMVGIRGMAMKDNTLFLANYRKENVTATETGLPTGLEIKQGMRSPIDAGSFNGHAYSHSSQLKLSSWDIGHFKHGQEYMLGYQLMDSTGAWGEPVFLGFSKMTTSPLVNESGVSLPFFYSTFPTDGLSDRYKAVRPLVAYVQPDRQRVKCQGVVTPSIFSESERATKLCYAKHSPFARTFKYAAGDPRYQYNVNPSKASLWVSASVRSSYNLPANNLIADIVPDYASDRWNYADLGWRRDYDMDDVDVINGTYPANGHLEALGASRDYNCEIESCVVPTDVLYRTAIYPVDANQVASSTALSDDYVSQFITVDNSKYYVDCSTVELDSPDVTDETGQSMTDGRLSIVGSIRMNGFSSDCDIVAGAAPQYKDGIFRTGFAYFKPFSAVGGRCAMTLPNWLAPYSNGATYNVKLNWAVYPYQKGKGMAGTNDDPDGGEFGQLTYKQLANYRFSDGTNYIDEERGYDGSSLYYSDGRHEIATVMEQGGDKVVYHGGEDTVVNASSTHVFSNGPRYNRITSEVTPLIYSDSKRNVLNMGPAAVVSSQYKESGVNETSSELSFLSPTALKLIPQNAFLFNNERLLPWAGLIATSEMNADQTSMTTTSGPSDVDHAHAYGAFSLAASAPYTGFAIVGMAGNSGMVDEDDMHHNLATELKYSASPHLVCKLGEENGKELVLPNTTQLLSALRNDGNVNRYFSMWHQQYGTWDEACPFVIGERLTTGYGENDDQLWLAEVKNFTGEYSEEVDATAYTEWYIAGPTMWMEDAALTWPNMNNHQGQQVMGLRLRWLQGDWYFQRYECLRTFAPSVEDLNQYVEIVSFYCETKTNIDGRYDKNRGRPFLQANPTNFNLINDSYTQLPNYFAYTQYSKAANVEESYPCQVTWSLPKVLNSVVDEWTSITGAAFLDMDGDKGEIVKLVRYRDGLMAFQPRGIAAILYNSKAAIPTDSGVPIQLGSSGKVEGKMYVSNTMGATHARSIHCTDVSVYFVDQFNRSLMMIGGESPSSITDKNGFHAWMVERNCGSQTLLWDNSNKGLWLQDSPTPFVYDPDEKRTPTLEYSEKLTGFQAFYDYDNTLENINVQDDTLLLHKDFKDGWHLWRMNAGEYNDFFWRLKPYWVDAVCLGSVGQGYSHHGVDKTYDYVEFKGDLFGNSEQLMAGKTPFNRIRAYTELQDTWTQSLTFRRNWNSNASNLKQKYRIWDCVIPRDMSETYSKPHFRNRIRNPWAHVVLSFDPWNCPVMNIDGVSTALNRCRATINDIEVSYS